MFRRHVVLILILGAARQSGAQSRGFIPMPDGARLYYETIGRGAEVVVPGGFLFGEALAPLASRNRLILYDMRNRGRSSAVSDSTTLTIRQDVRDLETVRAHFQLARPSLIGFSYLGLMVAMYAMEHPDRVARVVQLGPVPLKFGTSYPDSLRAQDEPVDSAAWADLQRQQRAGMSSRDPKGYCETEWQVLRGRLIGNQANLSKLGAGNCDLPNEWPINLQRHFRLHFGSVQALDIPVEMLSRIQSPVLTIHGTKDRNAPYGAGREWAMRLPHARLLPVEGAAHMSWVDAPDLVLGAIAEFLGGRWPQATERVDSTTIHEVLALIDSVLSAGARADTLALGLIYTPDYIHTNANGSRMTRAEVMGAYRARAPGTRVGATTHDEDWVVVGDSVALVSSRVTQHVSDDAQAQAHRFRVSYFLERRNGRWMILASHASILMS